MQNWRESQNYSHGSSDDDAASSKELLLPHSEFDAQSPVRGRQSSLQHKLLYINIALLLCSLSALAGSVLYIKTGGHGIRNALLRKTSFYSPLFDWIDIPTKVVKFNGTLFPQDPPSIFRQSPSPEVDKAWQEISVLGAIGISKEHVEKLGRDSSKAVTAPPDWNLGDQNYLAYVDVFHQIHCLDTLRKAAHYDYYFRDEFGPEGPSNGHWIHLSHCTHMLLQNLMCNADVDLFTYRWVEGQSHPYPDFSNNHQCRDFSAVFKWTKEHALDVERSRAYLKPKDVLSEPEPGTFEGAADWAFKPAHAEFSKGYQRPNGTTHKSHSH